MKTYDVIHQVETAYCDVGIIAIRANDIGIMKRYLSQRNLSFTPFLEAFPHVFVRNKHRLSNKSLITIKTLENFPYVTYEQGDHNVSFFAEEIVGRIISIPLESEDYYTIGYILCTDRNVSGLTEEFVDMLNLMGKNTPVNKIMKRHAYMKTLDHQVKRFHYPGNELSN